MEGQGANLEQTQLTLDTDLTQYQREMLNIVHNLANSLLTIIDDILDISKSKCLLSTCRTHLS